VPQPTREEAAATLESLRDRVLELLARVPEGRRTQEGIGGGDWSVKDLMGHLAHWESLALEAIEAWGRDSRPVAETYFAGGAEAIDAANAKDAERKAAWDYEEVRVDADDVHARLLEAIKGMSDEQWQAKAPYPTERRNTMASLLGSILGAPKAPFGHASAHLPDLEAFISSLD
jgi:hypothetical protein